MKLFQFFALAAVAIGTTFAATRDSRLLIEMVPMRDGGIYFLKIVFVCAHLFPFY